MSEKPVEQLDDQELLRLVQAKDEAGLAALYDRYSGLVFTLALRIVGDREVAREVMQDAFWRCWDGAETYDAARGGLAAWLMAITRNRAIDTLRSRQHQARLRERDTLPEADSQAEPSQGDESERIVIRQTVLAALKELAPGQRQAIEMAYFDGLTQAEIAASLGTPLGTIKTRMRAGLERLRSIILPSTARAESEGHHD